jgi:L-asparaginase II
MISVEVVRGNFIESRHQIYAVVVNAEGHLIKEYGDPKLITSPRSAIKFLQALPLIESGAADAYKLVPEQIALACSSHNAENRQLEYLDQWMAQTHIHENWLHCGPQMPGYEPAAWEWIRSGRKLTPKLNNCSGKHLGMMTVALHLGEEPQSYFEYNHPRQSQLRKLLTEITGYDYEKAQWGIDGCGIPTYGVSILSMAMGMSYMIRPNKVSKDLQHACNVILKCVKDHPYFISGTGDFTTDVIEKTEGRSLIKVGAEGVYCGMLPEKGLAFALKCLDGTQRGADAATTWLLQKHGGLEAYPLKPIKNWVGEIVGEYRVSEVI